MLGGFFGKVFGGFVAVVLAAGLLVYLNALPGIEEQVYRDVEKRVAQESELLAELVGQAWQPDRQSFQLASMPLLSGRLSESRITILSATGQVLFDSHERAADMDNHLGRAEVETLRTPVTRFSDTRGETMVYQAAPVEVRGAVRGYARVAVSVQDRDARAAELLAAIRNGVLLASLISLVIAFVMARLVSRPLTQIAQHVGELGRAGLGKRLAFSGGGEFAQLALAINTMNDELGRQMALVHADKAEREAILAAMTDGLVAVDAEQKILLINGAARRLLDVQHEDPIGVPVWELHRSSEWNHLLQQVDFGQSPTENSRSALCRLKNQAAEVLLEVSAVGFCAPESEQMGAVFVLRDVTELHRLEAVRRDFVANVSHELKTPMTAMRGFLEVVLADPGMEQEKREHFLTRTLRNTEQLSAIVSDLLSLSRLESQEHGLRFERVDLAHLFEAVAEESADLADSRHIEVEYEPLERAICVQADEQALRMALMNLVTNAIRYSPMGSRVTVRALCPGLPGREGNQLVHIEVQDEGPGIPEIDRERIFERFYRVDKVRTRGLGGTGLGLAIVRHVMGVHGGSVELLSEQGQGCLFRLSLDEAAQV